MDKNILKEILMEKSMTFTREELQKIIDEELEKSEEEMDTELIEQCLDLIESPSVNASENDNRIKKLRISKILLTAAIIAVLLGIAIPVGAKFMHIDAAKNVVEYYNNHFRINMSEENLIDTAQIVDAAAKMGVKSIALPTALFNDECVIGDLEIKELDEESCSVVYFTATNNGIFCYASLCNFKDSKAYNKTFGLFDAPNECEKFVQLKVNGIDVLVYSDGENSIVYYQNGFEYELSFSCDFEKAVSIAKTIDVIL